MSLVATSARRAVEAWALVEASTAMQRFARTLLLEAAGATRFVGTVAAMFSWDYEAEPYQQADRYHRTITRYGRVAARLEDASRHYQTPSAKAAHAAYRRKTRRR